MKQNSWRYRLLWLVWLLPAYFLVMAAYQAMIYRGIESTVQEGSEHQAVVTGFDLKQIAAQTNGYIDLEFTSPDGDVVEQRLALPVQMAQVLMDYETIPVRYNPGSFNEIVMMPTYELQRNMIRVNLAVLAFGLLVTLIIAWKSGQFAAKKLQSGREELVIERVDRSDEEPDGGNQAEIRQNNPESGGSRA